MFVSVVTLDNSVLENKAVQGGYLVFTSM